MRTLKFKVEGQALSKDGDFSNIALGTKNYLQAHFTFDSEWNGYAKVAVFTDSLQREYFRPLVADQCTIPNEVTDEIYFEVSVVGRKGSVTATTSKQMIIQGG